MSKLNEHDLLMFLAGNADKKEMQNIQEWVSASEGHARDLEDYKLVFDNFNELSLFKPVDDDAEWQAFMTKAGNSMAPVLDIVEDADILAHLDGLADYDQKSKVQNWRSTATENEQSYQLLSTIYKESNELKRYKPVDVQFEWTAFEQLKAKNIPARNTIETFVPTNTTTRYDQPTPVYNLSHQVEEVNRESIRANVTPIWYRYAVAASMAAVFALAWFLWPRNNFETIYADNGEKVFQLKDGSEVVLQHNSSLTYPKKFNDERRVYLDGKGSFSVESDPNKPFTVEARKTKLGVTVLGTKFRFEDSDIYDDVIENIEGSIRAYSIENPGIYVTMTKGDKYGFDGRQFIDLNDVPVIDNSKEYNILYVLDFLMQSSSWKVISAPYIKFDEKGMVMIDLEKPIDEIFFDLTERADFQYSKLEDCTNCYRIERFAERD